MEEQTAGHGMEEEDRNWESGPADIHHHMYNRWAVGIGCMMQGAST